MNNPTIRDLADKCKTAELYAELCRECGTDAVTEEGAIISALPATALPPADTEARWLFLADQTVSAQEEHDAGFAAGHETTD